MKTVKVIALLCILALAAFQPVSFAENVNEAEGFDLGSIEITINGVPIETVLGTVSGMFVDSFEENLDEAILGINDVLGEFAIGMSEDLDIIGGTFMVMTEVPQYLSVPFLEIDAETRRSIYNSALELYQAQLAGEANASPRLSKNDFEGCGNRIVYIYDTGDFIPAIIEAAANDGLAYAEVLFGAEGSQDFYEIVSALYLSPSDEPYAMCNMTDISDRLRFETYTGYVFESAFKNCSDGYEFGDSLLTLVFWNDDTSSEWLTLVARKIDE